MRHAVFERPGLIARAAGFLYLAEMITGAISVYALGRIVVAGNASATAANVRAHERLFVLSFSADLVQFACYIAVTAFLYWLLRPVNPLVSGLAACFSLAGCSVGAVSCMLQIAPLILVRDPEYLNVFNPGQRDALSFLIHRLYTQSFEVSFVLFGFYCVVAGYLFVVSRFVPRLVGAAMMFAGLVWLLFLWPPLAESLFRYIVLAAIGELSLALWLAVVGVDEHTWKQAVMRLERGAS